MNTFLLVPNPDVSTGTVSYTLQSARPETLRAIEAYGPRQTDGRARLEQNGAGNAHVHSQAGQQPPDEQVWMQQAQGAQMPQPPQLPPAGQMPADGAFAQYDGAADGWAGPPNDQWWYGSLDPAAAPGPPGAPGAPEWYCHPQVPLQQPFGRAGPGAPELSTGAPFEPNLESVLAEPSVDSAIIDLLFPSVGLEEIRRMRREMRME